MFLSLDHPGWNNKTITIQNKNHSFQAYCGVSGKEMGRGTRENENSLKLSIPFGVVLAFYHSVICEGCGSNKSKMRISCLIFSKQSVCCVARPGSPRVGNLRVRRDALCSHCSPLRSGEYWWLELPAVPRKKRTNAFVSTPLPGDSPVSSITGPTWKEFSSLSSPPVFCKCPLCSSHAFGTEVLCQVSSPQPPCPPLFHCTLLLGCCLSPAVWAKILTRSQ